MSELRGAVAAEWIKVRTVRSSAWTLLTAFALCVGLGLLVGRTLNAEYDSLPPVQHENWDPVALGFYGLTIGQVALVAFGVLMVGSEYTSGTIRTSLTAVPRRGVFYAAKVLTGVLVALPFGLATAFATFALAQPALGRHGTSLGAPGVLRAVLFAALYLTLICLFAMAVATLLRGTALPLAIMIPLLLLDSQGLGNVPRIRDVMQYLPDQAGTVMVQVVRPQRSFVTYHVYGPWAALAIVTTWTAVALIAAYATLRRRDA